VPVPVAVAHRFAPVISSWAAMSRA
jgi:hypothetical protein